MRNTIAIGAALATMWAVPSAHGDWDLQAIGRVDQVQTVVADFATGRIAIIGRRGTFTVETTRGGWVRVVPGPQPRVPRPPPDAIPYSHAAVGDKNIALAWLADPTRAYRGNLGAAAEAGTLAVRTAAGEEIRYKLPEGSVFEDLRPRLADITGDGDDEIILVRSYFDKGSALAVFGLRDGALALVAESEPVGLPHRWLNPVGAADFTGDGNVELAGVVLPQLSGTLTFYRLEGDGLRVLAQEPGFSTHAMGTTVIDMSVIVDIDGDGIPDIVLPARDRRGLVAVSFAGGVIRELARSDLFGRISSELVLADLDANDRPDIVFALDNGNIMAAMR